MSIDPPRPKPPPLTALRAFEAAARLGGFARAADELSVTPGAISQQVRLLEEWAGVALFERNAQGVTLSPSGRRVLPAASSAFDSLGGVAQELRNAAGNNLHIAALPALAQLWLAPRLGELRTALSDIEVSVTALGTPPNLLRDPFSLSLFYGPPQQGIMLERDEIFPVCTAEIANQLSAPADVARFPCLTDASWPDDWQMWLTHICEGPVPKLRGPKFSLYALALAEAEAGAGLLMGHQALVTPALMAGRLVRPFPQSLRTGNALIAYTAPPPNDRLAHKILGGLGVSAIQ